MKLLFIDDELDSCRSFHAMFRRQYEITTFTAPQKALDWIKDNPVDVVLSDFDMPVIDGIQCLEMVVNTQPNCTRILITGSLERSSIEKALEKGILHFCIRKPWRAEEIISILEGITI